MWGQGGRVGGTTTEEACGGGNEANRALVSLAFGVSALLPRWPAFSFPLHASEALARSSFAFARRAFTPALELAPRGVPVTDRLPFGGRSRPRRERRPASGEGNGARGRRRRWAGRDGTASSVAVVGDPHDAQLATETTSPARPANYVLTRLALARLDEM